MGEALVQVVDVHDRPVGTASTQEVQSKGLWHRVVRVMIESPDGHILLQKRVKKRLYPDRWDNSAAGKVDAGETTDQAVRRETGEELGIGYLELDFKQTDYYPSEEEFEGLRLNEFNTVYRAILDPREELHPNPREVQAVRWVSRDELRQLVADHPEQCTPGLRDVVQRLYIED